MYIHSNVDIVPPIMYKCIHTYIEIHIERVITWILRIPFYNKVRGLTINVHMKFVILYELASEFDTLMMYAHNNYLYGYS